MCLIIMKNKQFNSDLKTIIKKNLENKLQKTLTKGMIVISLMGLTSLSGCRSYLHNCPTYTNNGEEIEILKTDTTIDMVMDYHKQNYQLTKQNDKNKINTDERGYN